MELYRKPTLPEVLPMMWAYVAKPGNGVGGNLHIVLDEGNVCDGHILYCLDRCREKGDTDGVALAETLLRMSKTQRSKLSDRMYDGEGR